MEKENYRVEDIIFGLRGEYLHHKEKLTKLKEYVFTVDRRVQDLNFRLHQAPEHNPNLYLNFKVKENALAVALREFLLKFGWDTKIYGKETSKVLRDFNDEFVLSGYYHAQILNDVKFAEVIKAIMNSEFAQNIAMQLNDPQINIGHSVIHTALSGENSTRGSLWYYSQDDYIELYQHADTSLILPEALAVEVPKNKLPEYHTNYIDAFLEERKGIIIEDTMSSARTANYRIDEDEDVIILRRTK